MEFLQPSAWAEALQLKAAYPHAVPIQGGTDVMVELNFDRYRPGVPPRPDPGAGTGRVGPGQRAHLARRRGDLHEGADRAG